MHTDSLGVQRFVHERMKDLINILLPEAQNACECRCEHTLHYAHSNNTLHANTYVGIHMLCMCVSMIQEEESYRSITDLCRGGGGGQTKCATNRRRCAVVTHRQRLRPNEVLGRPCHNARDHPSLLVARFSRSVQVSSWFVAQ